MPKQYENAMIHLKRALVGTTLAAISFGLAFVIIIGLGVAIETIGEYREQHDRCLISAANPFEASRCN